MAYINKVRVGIYEKRYVEDDDPTLNITFPRAKILWNVDEDVSPYYKMLTFREAAQVQDVMDNDDWFEITADDQGPFAEGMYLVTVELSDGTRVVEPAVCFIQENVEGDIVKRTWVKVYDITYGNCERKKLIAWRYLPDPIKINDCDDNAEA